MEPEPVLSSETQQINTADVVRFIVSNKGSLATVLEEASKVGGCRQRLRQEALSVLKCDEALAESTSKRVKNSVSEVDRVFGELPKVDIIKYFVEHPDELCKILTESSVLANEAWQSYLYPRLASGQLCHKDHFDKLLSADSNNTLLNAMQSFLMQKRSTEEILQKMPLQSIMQYATSRLIS